MVNLAGVRVPSTSKRQMVFGCSLSAKDILTVVVGVVGGCFVAVSPAEENVAVLLLLVTCTQQKRKATPISTNL